MAYEPGAGMEDASFVLNRAHLSEHDVIIGLIDAAAEWLRTKNTDQWKEPWPSEEDRRHRIRRDLIAGKTWIAWRNGTLAATITADQAVNRIWPIEIQRDPAVYVYRLVVGRDFAGQGLGAALLDWAGLRARQQYGARWVRVDLWTTNIALHSYYLMQGFRFCGFSEGPRHYPSAALFQKETEVIRPSGQALFSIQPPPGG